jgi:hypothetical protein
VDSAVEVGKPLLQAGLILLPGHVIHPGGCVPLQRVKTLPQQIDREMVE